METINIGNGVWHVVNAFNGEILHIGSEESCEDFMYSIFLSMSGI